MRTLTQKEWIAIIVALAVIALFVTGLTTYIFPSSAAPAGTTLDTGTMASTTEQNPSATSAAAVAASATGSSTAPALPTPQPNQILVHDIVVGTGTEAVAGDTLTVDYVGTLQNGTKFDSSIDRGQPFSFTLGAGQVIKGWDQGVVGMKVGGIRLLVIPPDLGYGAQAVGTIPANSVLVFEIKLEGVTK